MWDESPNYCVYTRIYVDITVFWKDHFVGMRACVRAYSASGASGARVV